MSLSDEQVAAVSRVLTADNRRDNAHSVASLGDHIPKVRQLITDLWQATGAHPGRVQPFTDKNNDN